MKVYHFINCRYGIRAIQEKKLKVSRIDGLNDPFELLSIDLSHKSQRPAHRKRKADINDKYGLHCFSKDWKSPLLWSHYADNHRGICLVFDVPETRLVEIEYKAERLVDNDGLQEDSTLISDTDHEQLLKTKFEQWQYEEEWRWIINLNEAKKEGEHYFSEFSSDLTLKK